MAFKISLFQRDNLTFENAIVGICNDVVALKDEVKDLLAELNVHIKIWIIVKKSDVRTSLFN